MEQGELEERERNLLDKRKVFFIPPGLPEKPDSADYLEILNEITTIVKEYYKKNPDCFPYTIHDATHCMIVEEYLYQLIPDEKYANFRLKEKFLLIASVWLHDVGMIPSLFCNFEKDFSSANIEFDEKTRGLLSDERAPPDLDLKNNEDKDTIAYTRRVRKYHAKRSSLFIQTNKEILALNKKYRDLSLGDFFQDLKIIAQICELHPRKESIELEKMNNSNWIDNPVRIPLLVGYLRLADAIHVSDKGDWKDFLNFLSMGLDTETKFHWFKSNFTKYIEPFPERHTIVITTKIPSSTKINESKTEWTKNIKSLQKIVQYEILDELNSVKEILCKGGISYFSCIETNSEIDTDFFEDYLIDEYKLMLKNIDLLFDTSKTPSSSLIAGNIVKTLTLLLEGSLDHKVRTIKRYYENVLIDYTEKPQNTRLKRSKHGLLAPIIEDIEQILKEKDDSERLIKKINTLQDTCKNWEKKREETLTELCKNSVDLFPKGSSILLYGYSDTVLKCIDHCLSQNEDIILNFYVCEVRSKTEYRYNNRLEFSDGLLNIQAIIELKNKYEEKKEKERIKITYLPDSGVSHLFSKKMVDKVILSINSFDYIGNASHTLGALTITDSAKKNKIPVYIITESLKRENTRKSLYKIINLDKSREKSWFTTDNEFVSILDNCTSFNPREDIIPCSNIEKFFTEVGSLSPKDIKKRFYN